MTGMGLNETETETGCYKRQFQFFQPEPEYFLTILFPVETEPERSVREVFETPPTFISRCCET